MRCGPFGESLKIKAKYFPKDRIAIVHGDRKISWKELDERVNRIAQGLLTLGLKIGEKCALIFKNRPEFVESILAVQKIGAVPVPINYRFARKELEYVLDNSDSKILIFEEEFKKNVMEIRSSLKKVKNYICFGGSPENGILSYEELLSSPPREPKVYFGEDLPALLCYTGGTTGIPKGVVLTYDNLISNIEFMTELFAQFFPPVSELSDPRYAKNEFERRLLGGIEASGGLVFTDFSKDPVLSKKVVTLESDKVILTLATKEGKLKIFTGKPQRPDLLLQVELGEHVRDLSRLLPMSYKLSGKLKLGIRLFIRFFASRRIKIHGSRRLRLRFMRAMARGKGEPLAILLVPPIFHMAGYGFVIAWFGNSGTLVFPVSGGFDPREVLELLEKEKIRWVLLVPTMWKRVIEHPDVGKFDLRSITLAISGGAFFKGSLKKKVLSLFPNAVLFDGFGMTEMAPLTTGKLDGDVSMVKDRSIGRPLPGVKVKIVGEDGREIKEPGIVGELIYSGPTVMKEYYKDPERTRATIKDGWLYSGDLAYYGKDGEIYIAERKDECISSGAEKIYPEEVESLLREHPLIEECCVIGIPDEEWGESVRAIIQLKEGGKATEEEIIEWCKGKIAPYKKPKSVIFVDSLPVTPVGKVQRAKVKEKYGR